MPQPPQRNSDILAIVQGLSFPVSIHLTTIGTRLGTALDGVLVGSLTPAAVGSVQKALTGGTVFTDMTAAANQATINDVAILSGVPVLNDAVYYGHATKRFSSIKIKYSTAANWTLIVTTWEYWNGTAWVALVGIIDSTVTARPFATAAGTYFVTWQVPTNWVRTTVNGVLGYFVRERVTTAAGATTTAPLVDQIFLGTTGAASGNGIVVLPGALVGSFGAYVAAISWIVKTTLSAANNDTKLNIVNVTSGGSYTFTATKALPITHDLNPGLPVNPGDQLAVQMIQGDGTTEFAGVELQLHIKPQ